MQTQYPQPKSSSTTHSSHLPREIILQAQIKAFRYGSVTVLRDVNLPIYKNSVTAFIGSSGCGKSTLLRCFNRLNDLEPRACLEGAVFFHGCNIYHPQVDAAAVRRHIGIVFQKPNPFPKSIYENIAFGPRLNGFKGDMDEIVEQSLRQADLWNEVKDRMKKSALVLSGGQQQRLCIARALAVQPEVILMDEPCSALDPISTQRIEELLLELKKNYTVIIVTHNLQQATRISDFTAFFNVELQNGVPIGTLVEYKNTTTIFQNPTKESTRRYVLGQFG
ncbi:MAG: phosphate ABC transporter ATP-binding protein [Chlorogloeopsis fritschii C42_A2020_084]|uniref:phosphate ABC transporter ATP-binding protein PstB n=1 Tax=Chlorogloeopsis fritschii TaxID=1124 RepID=UPI0019E4C45B|nr:phosphate ABC transporter ATP-binding protein PstB [Chlorogloeopsis fritschii]MBF2005684.1 phosphate ABC transporter ATP-binding protein [Chlorogloeopsis fritschii C42_A2020_084]